MFKAIRHKVVLEIFDKRNETRSGLFLPVTINNAFVPTAGIVISVGPSVPYKEIIVGAKVAVEKYSGDKVQSDGRDFLILNYQDILAILSDDADVATREEDKPSLI